MRILGLDVETSGLDAKKDRIIEIGCVLYDVETATPVQMISELVDPSMDLGEGNFKVPEEIVTLTGISDEMLNVYGSFERDVLLRVDAMALLADYYIAHNAPFDRGFLEAAYARHSMIMLDRPWICSMNDIKYPAAIKTRNLQHLAADHGFVSPFRHRAVFDVLTMLKVASNYKIEDIISRAKEPTLYVQAIVGFDEKELAKARGYRWYAPSKVWWREWKSSDYNADKLECPFRTQLLAGPLE